MFKIESGVLDPARLVSNLLMLVLVAGNIFFGIQYTEALKEKSVPVVDNTSQHIKIARFLQEFIAVVLSPQGTVSVDDRVKLENDIRQLGDAELLAQWQAFVGSTDAVTAQKNAVLMMSLLSAKMLQ